MSVNNYATSACDTAATTPATDTRAESVPSDNSEPVSAGLSAELKVYESAVERSIVNKNSELFGNRSAAHAAVIMGIFCRHAKDSIQIYCGKLSKDVYGALLPYFESAIARNIHIQLITENERVESPEVAHKLAQHQAWRVHAPEPDLPHFAIVDNQMYRVETDRAHKAAVVCPYVPEDNEDEVSYLRLLKEVFQFLWEDAKPMNATLSE